MAPVADTLRPPASLLVLQILAAEVQSVDRAIPIPDAGRIERIGQLGTLVSPEAKALLSELEAATDRAGLDFPAPLRRTAVSPPTTAGAGGAPPGGAGALAGATPAFPERPAGPPEGAPPLAPAIPATPPDGAPALAPALPDGAGPPPGSPVLAPPLPDGERPRRQRR